MTPVLKAKTAKNLTSKEGDPAAFGGRLVATLVLGAVLVTILGSISFRSAKAQAIRSAQETLLQQSSFAKVRILDTAKALKAWAVLASESGTTDLSSGEWAGVTRVRLFRNRVRLDLSQSMKASTGWAADYDSGPLKNDSSPVPDDLFEVAGPIRLQFASGDAGLTLLRWIFVIARSDGSPSGAVIVDTEQTKMQALLFSGLNEAFFVVDRQGEVVIHSPQSTLGFTYGSREDLNHLSVVRESMALSSPRFSTYKAFPQFPTLYAVAEPMTVPFGTIVTQMPHATLEAALTQAAWNSFVLAALAIALGFVVASRFRTQPRPKAAHSQQSHLSPEKMNVREITPVTPIFSRINKAKTKS